MSKKVEIDAEVLQRWVEYWGEYGEKADDPVVDLFKAAIEALPPTREEELGLPWTFDYAEGPNATNVWQTRSTYPVNHGGCNRRQAKLIAAAPKMAHAMEQLLERRRCGIGWSVLMGEVEDLLKEAGWLED